MMSKKSVPAMSRTRCYIGDSSARRFSVGNFASSSNTLLEVPDVSLARRYHSSRSINNLIASEDTSSEPSRLSSLMSSPSNSRPGSRSVSPCPVRHKSSYTIFDARIAAVEYRSKLQPSIEKLKSHDLDVATAGIRTMTRVMQEVWIRPSFRFRLANDLCDELRESKALDRVVAIFLKGKMRMECGHLLTEVLSSKNIQHLMSEEKFLTLIQSSIEFAETSHEALHLSIALVTAGFRFSEDVSLKLIEMGAMDHVLASIQTEDTDRYLSRAAAMALANLSVYSNAKCHNKMLMKNVISWLFMLASSSDPITRYYALFSRCFLALTIEKSQESKNSGCLQLVEPFVTTFSPTELAEYEGFVHNKFKDREWLRRVLYMFHSNLKQPTVIAAYHFALEAICWKDSDDPEIFKAIGAVESLKVLAASPQQLPARFATVALEIIGEETPKRLSPEVPLWTTDDVVYWVEQIGFPEYAERFRSEKVDGDLLLETEELNLISEIEMHSTYHRRRFMRELDALKMAADYSRVDDGGVAEFLTSIDPRFSLFAYRFIKVGLEASEILKLTDHDLRELFQIENPLFRQRILRFCASCQTSVEPNDLRVAILKQSVDIFISYRRSSGSQLASLIRVLLKLRGFKVFIDVERLSSGTFDSSLLNNIRAADNFLLILTQGSLDRCGDDDDWVRKEIKCALDHGKNVIPIVEPRFEWPAEGSLPADIREIRRFNVVNWVHEYQNACLEKVEKFLVPSNNYSQSNIENIDHACGS